MRQAEAGRNDGTVICGVRFSADHRPVDPTLVAEADTAEAARHARVVWKWASIRLDSPHDYITGTASMALAAPNLGGKSCWYTECRNPSGAPMETAMGRAWAEGVRVANQVLGREHLTDIREGLRNAGHPQGGRERPIPGATHVRAVLEMAWQHAHEETLKNSDVKVETVLNARKLRRWLNADELAQIEAIGERMGRHCDVARLQTTWRSWLQLVAATRRAEILGSNRK